MKKAFLKLLFLFMIIFCISPNASVAQNKQFSQNKQFVVLESGSSLSDTDIQKIEAFNFDQYRFFNIRQKVQIVRGPLIELFSVSEMQKSGIDFSKNYIDMIKSRSESFKHESIKSLDLGLGVYPAYEPK